MGDDISTKTRGTTRPCCWQLAVMAASVTQVSLACSLCVCPSVPLSRRSILRLLSVHSMTDCVTTSCDRNCPTQNANSKSHAAGDSCCSDGDRRCPRSFLAHVTSEHDGDRGYYLAVSDRNCIALIYTPSRAVCISRAQAFLYS